MQRMGDMLRDRREQLGFSVEQAAQMTNIRSRVLEAFESSDYENFPPSGYAQGMLSSYARFLNLDPQRILSAYQNEYAAFSERDEMKKTASRARKGLGRFGEHRESGVQPKSRKQNPSLSSEIPIQADNRAAQEHMARHDDRYKSGSVRVVNSRPAGGTGSYPRYREHPRASLVNSNTAGSSTHASSTRRAGRLSSHSAISPESSDVSSKRVRSSSRSSSRSHASSSTGRLSSVSTAASDVHEIQEPGQEEKRLSKSRSSRRRREEAAPASEGNIVKQALDSLASIFKDTRSRLIAAAALLIVIALVVAANMLISTAGDNSKDVIEVQGGAQDTTTTNTDSKTASATITTTNGNPVSVHIEVAEGQTSLVNVTFDDDNAYSGTAVGPWSRDFQVTESMTATFGTPDAVTVTENGTQVDIEKKDDGSGVVTLKIETASTTEEDEQ